MKQIFILLTLYLCFSCKKYEDKDGMITTKLSLDVIESPKNTHFKTGFIVHMTIQNKSSKRLFFFRPEIEILFNGERNSIYAFGGMKDWRDTDRIEMIENYQDTIANHLTKKYPINDIIYDQTVKDAIFLKPNETKHLSHTAYGFMGTKRNHIIIYTSNFSMIDEKLGYQIYDNLPPVFNGYSFWVGKVRPDTLLLNTFKE